jgi:hypothetical protein
LQRNRAQGAQNRKLMAQHLKSIYRAASWEEAERRLADFAQGKTGATGDFPPLSISARNVSKPGVSLSRWTRNSGSYPGLDHLLLDQFQGLLNVSLILRRVNSMDKPNGRLVLVSYTHYCASTSSLSTRWSSWTLLDPFGLGDLILGRASRLYAFSGYHNRTSLPSRALGRTTGTQEVRPSRSSRTKDSPPQISYAHSR